jgi:hypothetical protein
LSFINPFIIDRAQNSTAKVCPNFNVEKITIGSFLSAWVKVLCYANQHKSSIGNSIPSKIVIFKKINFAITVQNMRIISILAISMLTTNTG